MRTDKIRIGIIGAGKNTREKHIPGLHALNGVEIISVCNRTLESSKRAAMEFNIPNVYENWTDLVAAGDTDSIIIGTWPYLHCPITLAALEANKHVMCEARMAMDASQARKMYEASLQKPHLVTQVVPSPFTLKVDNTIQNMLADGFLGEILAVEVRSYGNNFVDKEAPLHWRQDAALSGLNVMSLGVWYEAIMRWVGEATRIKAMGKTVVKIRRHPLSDEMKVTNIPEHLSVLAEMACGALASFSFSSASGLSGENTANLFGSQGTLSLRNGILFAGKSGDESLAELDIPKNLQRGWRVEEEFINAIRGLEPITHTTFADGLKYMQFTEAVARSMAESRGISLPLFDN
jgi:predicted dehydrogenase